MPRSAAARAMRMAISPRLAMRSFWKAMRVRQMDVDQPDSGMGVAAGERTRRAQGSSFTAGGAVCERDEVAGNWRAQHANLSRRPPLAPSDLRGKTLGAVLVIAR